MIWVPIVSAVIAVLVATFALVVAGPGWVTLRRLRRTAVVTLKSGETFKGLLWRTDSRVIVVRNATAVATDGTGGHITVDGELVVFRADVAYVQITS